MKIVLATYCSRGDVQPILALALRLKASGHEVLICAPPEQALWIEGYGCSCQPLGRNVRVLLESFPAPHTLRGIIAFVRVLRQELQVHFEQLLESFNGADLILGASLVFGAPTIAEYLGIPYRFIVFCPQVLASSHHPSWAMRNHNLPRWINRLSWWSLNHIDNLNFRGIINKKRRRLALKPIDDIWRHLLGDHVIVASDSLLAPVPMDVDMKYTQFGYFHLHDNGELSTDLKAFLHAGPAPVYIGFGSMPDTDPAATTRLLIKATREAGRRVIISSGWAQLGQIRTVGDCYVTDTVPHMSLFPHVEAVVHHGGSGTTATAARAGVPHIIVPHVLDQFYWANQVYRAGLSPMPIRRSSLTADRLASALRECISNEVMRQRAHKIGQILQGQDSLCGAVKFIESEFSEGRKGQRVDV